MNKKTVTDIIIERFLKDVEEKETMPWQRPYTQYNAFNYFTLQTYRGINRLLLPFGEYMTAKQINEYNKKNGEDFRFQKGITWYPVVFYKADIVEVKLNEVIKLFPDYKDDKVNIGYTSGWYFYKEGDCYFKKRTILRYTDVADRKYFRNSKGEVLPSRLDTGVVEITLSEPMNVINDYIERERINIVDTNDVPCYYPDLDTVAINNHISNEGEYFSTYFHELAHSTGHKSRLNREGVNTEKVKLHKKKDILDIRAKEECIAEICACLCCAECGVYDFSTSCTKEYDNNLAYVKSWKKRVLDWGKDFIYVVSEADKAFERILDF